jgi:hypothetical protein
MILVETRVLREKPIFFCLYGENIWIRIGEWLTPFWSSFPETIRCNHTTSSVCILITLFTFTVVSIVYARHMFDWRCCVITTKSLRKNLLTIRYLARNKLGERTLFRVCIVHWGLHDTHSLDLKANGHLGTFPRQCGLASVCGPVHKPTFQFSSTLGKNKRNQIRWSGQMVKVTC